MSSFNRAREFIRSPTAPLESLGLQHTYRTTRIAASLLALVATLLFGVYWANRPEIVIPGLVLLSCVILTDSYVRPRASWASMAMCDTPLFMAMFVLIGATAAIPFTAIAQAFMGFLFVKPLTAIRLTSYFVATSWIGMAVSISFDSQSLAPSQYLLVIVATSFLTVVPAAWALLMAGAEVSSRQQFERSLLAEKEALLVDKDRFVASVSHELRTPLTSVVGLAHTLADAGESVSEDERAEFLDLILRESEEVASIVDDLLVAARAESGNLALLAEEVSLQDQLENVINAVAVDTTASIEQITVIGDPVRIRQIIRNLLTNADRYGGTDVRITVSTEGSSGVLRITDNGQGVPDDRIDRIFTAYGRAHDRPGLTDSVGLGLTVSRQLARLMGGDVSYRRHDSLTVFELRLPLALSKVRLNAT